MQQEPLNWYQRAVLWFYKADKVINLFLSYALALSSLIAFLDVLGNGEIIQRIPALYFVWLAVQGLGVELQILIILGRLPELAQIQSIWKRGSLLVFHLVFIGLLGYISVIIGAIFTAHADMHGTVFQAEQALGVSTIPFVYQRAGIATMLLILMGIDRSLSLPTPSWVPRDSSQAKREPSSIDNEQSVNALVPVLARTLPLLLQSQTSTLLSEEQIAHVLRLTQEVARTQEQEGTEEQPGASRSEPDVSVEKVSHTTTLQETPAQGTDNKRELESHKTRLMENLEREPVSIQRDSAGATDEKLAKAFQEMQVEGRKITGLSLSQRAGIRKATALLWLRSQNVKTEQAHAQWER